MEGIFSIQDLFQVLKIDVCTPTSLFHALVCARVCVCVCVHAGMGPYFLNISFSLGPLLFSAVIEKCHCSLRVCMCLFYRDALILHTRFARVHVCVIQVITV